MENQNRQNQYPLLLLGTQNPGKLDELTSILAGLPIQIVTPQEIPLHLNIPEDGQTYRENALIKATAWATQTGLVTLADDSGLEVELLGGAPGLFSHRFTGDPQASDEAKRRFLIEKLIPYPRPWKARFYCAVVIAFPDRQPIDALGICHGEILPEDRGTHGFGYDPIFLVEDTGYTMAELSEEEKNRISHRARALLAIKPKFLAELGGAITES